MFALITQLYSLHTKGRILGCVPLGGSGFGFVIQDHIDLGTLEEWSFRVRSFGSMYAFSAHYSLEAHFFMLNSNDGIKGLFTWMWGTTGR